ncbi:hypothetical protein [Hydrogenivirga sp.]
METLAFHVNVLDFLAFGYFLGSATFWWAVAEDMDEPEGRVIVRFIALIVSLIAVVGVLGL